MLRPTAGLGFISGTDTWKPCYCRPGLLILSHLRSQVYRNSAVCFMCLATGRGALTGMSIMWMREAQATAGSNSTDSETLGICSAGCLSFRIKVTARGFVENLNTQNRITSAPSEYSSLCTIPLRGSVIQEKPSGYWSRFWPLSIF